MCATSGPRAGEPARPMAWPRTAPAAMRSGCAARPASLSPGDSAGSGPLMGSSGCLRGPGHRPALAGQLGAVLIDCRLRHLLMCICRRDAARRAMAREPVRTWRIWFTRRHDTRIFSTSHWAMVRQGHGTPCREPAHQSKMARVTAGQAAARHSAMTWPWCTGPL